MLKENNKLEQNLFQEKILELKKVLGLDDSITTQILESKKISKVEHIRKLAELNKDDWKMELTKAAAKINKTIVDKKLIGLHASSLARKLENEFPTTAFSAQLARQKKSTLKNAEALNNFFMAYPDFDLQNDNIDLFAKGKKQILNTDAKEELKAVQRVFKLVPHFAKANGLVENGMHSSQSIIAAGQSKFVNIIAMKAGIATIEANEIFKRAKEQLERDIQ